MDFLNMQHTTVHVTIRKLNVLVIWNSKKGLRPDPD